MKPSLFLLATISLMPAGLFAQDKTEHYWGKKGLDVAYSAAATNDGGYILTGLTQSAGDTVGDIVVIKTNAAGDTMWTLVYGGPNLEGGNYVMQTADGGYMVSGHTEDFGAEDCDAFLMKLDKNGKYQWLHVYGGIQDDISEGVVELPTGEFVIAGITASYGNADTSSEVRHVYFVKTTSTGDLIWYRYYAGKGSEYAYSIATCPNNGFLAVGYSTSFGNGEMDGWLMRLDNNGDTLWTSLYENIGETRYYKIKPTMDNGFIVTGFTTGTGKPQGLVIKLDADGNKVWEHLYGDTTQGLVLYDCVQQPNGNFMFTGGNYATDTTGNAYVLTTDANGNKITDQVYGGSYSIADCIASQGNNGYLIAGTSDKYDGAGDIYYMDMNNTVESVPAVNASWPHLYPNPVRSEPAVIVLPASEANEMIRLDIIDMSGRRVCGKDKIADKDILIDRNGLSTGEYLFHITCNDGKEYKGKFMVE